MIPSGLSGEERDAPDAVLLHRALRAIGDEAVRAVLELAGQDQACALDRSPVDIDLQRAADAGRPQSGVAHDTLRERRLGDDVRDGQATAWLEHTRRLPEDATLVRRQVDDAVADHAVGGAGFGRDLLDVALSVVDSTEAVSIAQPLGL